MPFASIEAALEALRSGRFVVVVASRDGDAHGHLATCAEGVDQTHINFMSKHGRGLIRVALAPAFFDALKIPLMMPADRQHGDGDPSLRVGVSLSARQGVGRGASAADRAHTIAVLTRASSSREDWVSPGHVFPVMADEHGVLQQRGFAEAAMDLARLAGFQSAGVMCEVLDEEGALASLDQLDAFAVAHDLPMITVEDLAAFRLHNEPLVARVEAANLPTNHGTFRAIAFRDHMGLDHLAMCKGDVKGKRILVRMHSECLTGDVFQSRRCDCGDQLDKALQRIQEHGSGIVLYLRQEGRGIGLANKIKAYALQEQGLDTVEANRHLGFPDDARTYDVGAAMLRDLGVESVCLMTNNPKKISELEACGIAVVERLEHQGQTHASNEQYLETKAKKMGHLL